MEIQGIVPQPVNSVEELVSKLDLIIEGMRQWKNQDTGLDFGLVLVRRLSELNDDFSIMDHCDPEELEPVMMRIESLKLIVNKSKFDDIIASNGMN
jgi:hypothetical protein